MCLILKLKQQHNQFTTILDIHIGIDNIRYIDTERDYERNERKGDTGEKNRITFLKYNTTSIKTLLFMIIPRIATDSQRMNINVPRE